jgi:hypothetical protein
LLVRRDTHSVASSHRVQTGLGLLSVFATRVLLPFSQGHQYRQYGVCVLRLEGNAFLTALTAPHPIGLVLVLGMDLALSHYCSALFSGSG